LVMTADKVAPTTTLTGLDATLSGNGLTA
jgi:hypothetical protein